MGTYSNRGHLGKTSLTGENASPNHPRDHPCCHDGSPSRSKRLLSADDVANIVQNYESGDTTQQIGTCCGISKTRVATVLREQNQN
jgi:hypothetical protein